MKKLLLLLIIFALLISSCGNTIDSQGNLISSNGTFIGQTGATGATGATGSSNVTGDAWVTGNYTVLGNLTAKTGRGATIIIASVNATALEKGQADYVVAGIDDQIVINAAISALPASGGKIQFTSGTFVVSSNISITKDHIRLVGAGNSEYGFYTTRGYGVTAIVASVDTNVVAFVHDATDGIGNGISNLTIRGFSKLTGSGYAGLLVRYQDVFTMSNLHIENNDYGVRVEEGWAVAGYQMEVVSNASGILWTTFPGYAGAGHNTLIGGFVAHNDREGMSVGGATNNDNRILGVHFAYNGAGGVSGKGLIIDHASYNTITGNIFSVDGKSDGMILDTAQYNTVTGNQFDGNTGDGLRLWGATNNTIVGNTSVGNLGAQISLLNGSTVDNNIIKNNTGFVDSNSGASVGTGAQQTISHGLSFTPTKQKIGIFSDNSTGTAYQSAVPDATNIYVTETNGSAWHWATVGN